MGKVVKAVVGIGIAVVGAVTGNFALVLGGLQIVGSSLLTPKSKGAIRPASATSVQLGEVPRQGLFGRASTAGSLVDAFNYGGKYGTDWEVLVLDLADHRCDALEGFYVTDQYVPFTGDGPVAGFNGQLSVWWRNGTENQSVPPVLLQNGPGWTANDNGAGISYVVVAYKADDAEAKNPVWPGGRPRFLWVVRGALCYSARADSSVGGSGAQRWAQPATRTWSENPIDCRYTWARGLYACDRVGDPAQLLIGRGLSAIEAPPENVFARANLCDELVDGSPRYRVGAIVDASAAFIDVENDFAAACAGTIVQPQGSVEVDPGEARAAVVTITDDDLVVGSKVTWNNGMLGVASAEWINTVVARYIEPGLKWAEHAAPVRRVVADVLADRQPREERLQLGFVTNGRQAGRVAEVRRRLGRLPGRATITLPPRFAALEEGDWIVWQSPRRFQPVFGADALTFRVEAWGSDAAWHHQLSLRQISASVFSDTAPLDDGSVALPKPVLPPIGAPAVESWDASTPSPTQLLIVGSSDDTSARFVRLELYQGEEPPTGDAVWAEIGVFGPDLRRHEAAVLPHTSYFVAVSYVVDGISGERLILGPVVTPALTDVAVVGYITNEAHIVPAEVDGTVISYGDAGGDFIVQAGGEDITAFFTLTVVANPQALDVQIAGMSYAVVGGMDLDEDSASIRLRATGSGPYVGFQVTKVFSLGKSKQLTEGISPALIRLTGSSFTARYDETGAYVGPAIAFVANRQNTTSPTVWMLQNVDGNTIFALYAADVVASNPAYWQSSGPDQLTLTAAGVTAMMAAHGGAAGEIAMVAYLEQASGIRDLHSIQKVLDGRKGEDGKPGEAAYTAVLSNEQHQLPAANDGTVLSYAGAETVVLVLQGGIDVTADFQLLGSDNPQGLTGQNLYPRFTIEGGFDAGEDVATITYQLVGTAGTPHEGVTISRTFSLSKSKAALDGTSPELVSLSSTGQIAPYSAAGGYTGGAISFVAERQNTARATVWVLRNVDGNVLFAGSAADLVVAAPALYQSNGSEELVLTAAGVATLMADHGGVAGVFSVGVELSGAPGIRDIISINRVRDGAQGVSALTAYLTNEAHIVPATAAGVVTSYAGAGGAVRLLSGITDVTGSFDFAASPSNPQGLAISYGFPNFAIVDGLDAGEAAATVTIRVVGKNGTLFAGIIIDRVFSLAKSRAPVDGTSPALIELTATAETARYNAAGAYVGPAIGFAAARQNTTVPTVWVLRNVDGNIVQSGTAASFVASNAAYWQSSGADQLTLTAAGVPAIMAPHGGAAGLISVGVELSGQQVVNDRVSINRVQDGATGAPGQSAIAATLSNEAHVVPADVNGNVTSYTGAGGAFSVFSGAADVSGAFSLGVVSNPYNLQVSFSGANFAVVGGMAAGVDTAFVTLRATGSGAFAGVSVDKVFSLTKSRAPGQGVSPALIALDASAVNARYNAVGTYVGPALSYTARRSNTTAATVWVLRNVDGSVIFSGTAAAFVSSSAAYWQSSGVDQLTLTAAGVPAMMGAHGGSAGVFSIGVELSGSPSIRDIASVTRVQDGANGAPGSPGAPGAPGQSAISATLSSYSVTIGATYAGQTKGGQLPKNIGLTVMRGESDITTSCAVTVTPSSASITASYGSRTVSINQADASGYVDVAISLAGAPVTTLRIGIDRSLDPAPPASQTSASASINTSIASNSYTGPVFTVLLKANTAGQLSFTGGAEYDIATGSGARTFTASAAIAWRPAGSGAFSYGTEVGGSQAFKSAAGDGSSGSVTVTQTLGGLTAGATYEVGLAFRRSQGAAGVDANVFGQFAVSQ